MPVKDAFEDKPKRMGSSEHEADSTGFLSAIPPAQPNGDEGILPSERQRRLRMLLVAALGALLVVGGTTLYITRPWDPNAYAIHSFTDADTSMEGYPGLRSHLSSQDFAEESVEQEYERHADKLMDILESDMGTYARLADDLVARLRGFIAGEEVDTTTLSLQALGLLQGLKRQILGIEDLDLSDEVLTARQQELLSLADYLAQELSILSRAAAATNQADSRNMAAANALSILDGTAGQSFDERRDLFANAYASLQSQKTE